jgi:hypothetical protein
MNKIYFIIILLLAGLPGAISAQTATVFELLQSKGVQDAEIETDLVALLASVSAPDVEVPGILRFEDNDGVARELSVSVTVRGRFRLQHCDFPPLKLNFSKKELKAIGLSAPQHDKLKLVTHCVDERYVAKENIAKEALAYEIARILTPYSYRTQLLRLRYIDSSGALPTQRRIAILLEDTDEMAARFDGTECDDCFNPAPEELDPLAENMHAWFQYLIGNVDYNLAVAQNLKLVTRQDGKRVPVPYDFDFSGLVSAPYASPNGQLGQVTIQDRVFIGQYASDAIMAHNIRQLALKRPAIEAAIAKAPLLSASTREATQKYIEEFYATLESLVLEGKSDYYQRLRARYAEVLPAGAIPQYFGLAK